MSQTLDNSHNFILKVLRSSNPIFRVWFKKFNRFSFDDNRYNQTSSYIISGSFNCNSLYLLRYDRNQGQLELIQSIQAYGPHQYLYLDRSNHRLYTTSWREPPHLNAWSIESHQSSGHPQLILINQAPITSVSSYITSKDGLLFSVGGPTGEIHQLEPKTGAIENKIQELLFIKAHESIENQDKSRKALRYGSHSIEISSLNQVFISHLGRNSILAYKYDAIKKTLKFWRELESVESGDGPRHAVVSEDGQRLYVVTEHTSRIDLYKLKSDEIIHQASSSLIHDPKEKSNYRGDTIRIIPKFHSELKNKEYIFATTRGKKKSKRGILAVFELDLNENIFKNLIRWETLTSGGKANAIEFNQFQQEKNIVELVLTDDLVGWVSVLEYDISKNTLVVISKCLIHQDGNIGASHAVWIR